MTSTGSPPSIGPASREELSQALGLIFSHSERGDSAARSDTLMTDTDSGSIDPQGVLVARRATRIVGAIFFQVQVGKTAVIWPPRVVPGESEVGGQLMQAALGSLNGRYLRVVHALSDGRCDGDDALLRSAGFKPLAELIYLVSGEIDFPSQHPSGPLEFEPYREADHDRFAELVEATYRATLDCPALDGIRDIEDVLAGYRTSGGHRPELWLIVRHESRDVGCLLLADHLDQGNCELVYMGLVVEARGSGWGRHVTRHAQWLTRQTGRSRLVLAVDEANWPARKMYASVGFHDWDRRSVYLKLFDTPV
jgi:ribosomal protein S18 acetylase RimI-like enzyme